MDEQLTTKYYVVCWGWDEKTGDDTFILKAYPLSLKDAEQRAKDMTEKTFKNHLVLQLRAETCMDPQVYIRRPTETTNVGP